jgi:nicotinamidase-related amidase
MVRSLKSWRFNVIRSYSGQGDTFKSNPRLASKLRDDEDINHVVAFGIQSDCCVRATCKGALEAGFNVTVLQGAHSTYDTDGKTAVEIERAIEEELSAEGAEIVPWEEWRP